MGNRLSADLLPMQRILVSFLLLNSAICMPAAAQKKAAAPSAVALGKYHCVFFISGQLQTVPGFTILADGKYQHDGGGKGTFSYDSNQAVITFQGAGLDKQAGLVENKDKQAIIRIYNERRSRTVIDCDAPRP